MFRYFPANYVWNLSVDLALEMGAKIGEVDAMCAPLQEAAKHPDAAGSAAFRATLSRMAEQLCELAAEDHAAGRMICAGDKYGRAATYYLTAERLQAHRAQGRAALYRRFLDTFDKAIKLVGENCERVEIPDGESHIAALYVRAEGVSGLAEGSFPVPHDWEHVQGVWGARDMDDFMRIAEDVHLLLSALTTRSTV